MGRQQKYKAYQKIHTSIGGAEEDHKFKKKPHFLFQHFVAAIEDRTFYNIFTPQEDTQLKERQ